MTTNFITQMLDNHQAKKKEIEQYRIACDKIQSNHDQKCLKFIEEYNSFSKKTMKEARSQESHSEANKKLDLIKKAAAVLYDQLMDVEMLLVEQFEEFIRDFEAKMGELTSVNLDTIHNLYPNPLQISTLFLDFS
jgi:hypothetical protein